MLAETPGENSNFSSSSKPRRTRKNVTQKNRRRLGKAYSEAKSDSSWSKQKSLTAAEGLHVHGKFARSQITDAKSTEVELPQLPGQPESTSCTP